MSALPLAHALLGLSLLLIFSPWSRLWSPTLLAALAVGLWQGQLAPLALLPLALMAALVAALSLRDGPPLVRGLLLSLGLALAVALALHLLPGFHNPSYMVQLSDALPAQRKYLNFDKGAAGLLLVALLRAAALAPDRQARPRMDQLLLIAALTLALPWGLAVAAGLGSPALRWPEHAALFLLSNLLFTCVAEEALFRGLIQTLLQARIRPAGSAWGSHLAPLAAALLFGLAHAGGGAAYVGLATLAGWGYGLVYQRSGRLEAAILLHFALNALVFLTLDLRLG